MLSKVAIKRPVSTVMILLIVVLAGISAYTGLDLAYMPTMDSPMAMVSCSYEGAGPEEVEELITKPLEQTLATLTGVDTINSTSSLGSSRISISFVDGTDLDMAAIDIREKLDQVAKRLPDDASDPQVMKMDMNSDSIMVGVTSKKYDLKSLYAILENNVSSQFEKIEGISSVDMMGGVENEIQITVDPEKLQGYGITINQIAQSLSKENSNTPAGEILQGNTSLQVRAVGKFNSIDEISNLPISTGSGNMIYIKDVATVKEVEKDQNSFALINGTEGIMFSLSKQSTANIVTVSDSITATIASLKQDYPDLDIQLLSSTADYIKLSVNNVVETAFQSALIAIVVLFIFLRDAKTSFIIGISIPTSILATFGLMYLKGMTMNTISMGGIVIGIGMLVDNSVVVLENIFKYSQEGMTPKNAAEVGAKEVSMAVLASTLTTVAVFLPLSFVSGMIGTMLKDLAYTICFALTASFFVSITFVPMACSLLLKSQQKRAHKKSFFGFILKPWGKALDGLDKGYRFLLKVSLKHKFITTAIVVAIFISSLSVTSKVGMNLMSSTDEGSASISISLPDGTVIEETKAILSEVLSRIDDLPETEMTFSQVRSTNQASVNINLVDMDNRSRSTDEIVQDIKERVSDIAGAEIKVSASAMAMGSFGGSSNISLTVKGDDNDTLRSISNDLVTLIGSLEGATDVESSLDKALVEANLVLNRAKASKYGISTSDLASAANLAISGVTATEYKKDGTEVDVVIKYADDRINYISDLKNITITTAQGSVIPITEVADIVMGESAVSISRTNQQKYITITGNIPGMDTSSVQTLLEQTLSNYVFPDNYSYEFGGSMQMMHESFGNLTKVLMIAILLVYMIMASQFESLIYPFIVMFSMPIAITGGIWGLYITGQSITVTAFMGFIMLIGMVVNNAIVLVDYTNQLIMYKDMNYIDALLEAGPSRLRPILMTTLTTIIGLMPMAFATAEGMETQQPLGIAVIFGLTLSTGVTLILIPSLYAIVTSIKLFFHKKKEARELKKYGKIA